MAYEKQEWRPVTGLGKLVASGEIKSIDQVLESGRPIKEPQIVDAFLPDLEDVLSHPRFHELRQFPDQHGLDLLLRAVRQSLPEPTHEDLFQRVLDALVQFTGL